MARFQIYIPNSIVGAKVAAADALAEVGLGHLPHADCGDCNGPAGAGRWFADIDPRRVLHGYKPEKQTWVPASAEEGAAGRYWVGFWSDDLPTEKDLRRKDHGTAEWLELGNGEHWMLATPKSIDRVPAFDAEGKLCLKADPAFAWLTMEIKRREAMIVYADDGETPLKAERIFADDFDLMFRMLRPAYSITKEVVVFLNLFPEQLLLKMCLALNGLTPANQSTYDVETSEHTDEPVGKTASEVFNV